MKSITIGHPLIRLESVDSTNDYATRLIRTGEVADGTVILAGYQSKGKGQGSNQWISEAGRNLLLSLVLTPGFLPAERQFYLSMCISMAIRDFIDSMAQPVKIKWPNDILLQGKKVAGMLIENSILEQFIKTTVAGIGINVNQQGFPPDVPGAISISMATGKEYDLSGLLPRLVKSLEHHVNRLYQEAFGVIKTDYLNNLMRLNEWAEFSDSSGIFEGRIADIADSGELLITLRNGEIRYYGLKEIAYR